MSMFSKPSLAVKVAKASHGALEILFFVTQIVVLFESLGGIVMYKNIY